MNDFSQDPETNSTGDSAVYPERIHSPTCDGLPGTGGGGGAHGAFPETSVATPKSLRENESNAWTALLQGIWNKKRAHKLEQGQDDDQLHHEAETRAAMGTAAPGAPNEEPMDEIAVHDPAERDEGRPAAVARQSTLQRNGSGKCGQRLLLTSPTAGKERSSGPATSLAWGSPKASQEEEHLQSAPRPHTEGRTATAAAVAGRGRQRIEMRTAPPAARELWSGGLSNSSSSETPSLTMSKRSSTIAGPGSSKSQLPYDGSSWPATGGGGGALLQPPPPPAATSITPESSEGNLGPALGPSGFHNTFVSITSCSLQRQLGAGRPHGNDSAGLRSGLPVGPGELLKTISSEELEVDSGALSNEQERRWSVEDFSSEAGGGGNSAGTGMDGGGGTEATSALQPLSITTTATSPAPQQETVSTPTGQMAVFHVAFPSRGAEASITGLLGPPQPPPGHHRDTPDPSALPPPCSDGDGDPAVPDWLGGTPTAATPTPTPTSPLAPGCAKQLFRESSGSGLLHHSLHAAETSPFFFLSGFTPTGDSPPMREREAAAAAHHSPAISHRKGEPGASGPGVPSRAGPGLRSRGGLLSGYPEAGGGVDGGTPTCASAAAAVATRGTTAGTPPELYGGGPLYVELDEGEGASISCRELARTHRSSMSLRSTERPPSEEAVELETNLSAPTANATRRYPHSHHVTNPLLGSSSSNSTACSMDEHRGNLDEMSRPTLTPTDHLLCCQPHVLARRSDDHSTPCHAAAPGDGSAIPSPSVYTVPSPNARTKSMHLPRSCCSCVESRPAASHRYRDPTAGAPSTRRGASPEPRAGLGAGASVTSPTEVEGAFLLCVATNTAIASRLAPLTANGWRPPARRAPGSGEGEGEGTSRGAEVESVWPHRRDPAERKPTPPPALRGDGSAVAPSGGARLGSALTPPPGGPESSAFALTPWLSPTAATPVPARGSSVEAATTPSHRVWRSGTSIGPTRLHNSLPSSLRRASGARSRALDTELSLPNWCRGAGEAGAGGQLDVCLLFPSSDPSSPTVAAGEGGTPPQLSCAAPPPGAPPSGLTASMLEQVALKAETTTEKVKVFLAAQQQQQQQQVDPERVAEEDRGSATCGKPVPVSGPAAREHAPQQKDSTSRPRPPPRAPTLPHCPVLEGVAAQGQVSPPLLPPDKRRVAYVYGHYHTGERSLGSLGSTPPALCGYETPKQQSIAKGAEPLADHEATPNPHLSSSTPSIRPSHNLNMSQGTSPIVLPAAPSQAIVMPPLRCGRWRQPRRTPDEDDRLLLSTERKRPNTG